MSEWQPIETAPRIKDYRIIGWDGSEINTMDYEPPRDGPYAKWCWIQVSDSGRATSFAPTHWMPLPEPPEQEKK